MTEREIEALSDWKRDVEYAENRGLEPGHSISVCKPGNEWYEYYTDPYGNEMVQYDFRKTTGELFACISMSLEACRKARDLWLEAGCPSSLNQLFAR